MSTRTCVLLAAHGTVESLGELEGFLTVIRRGHAPPASLVDEVRRRYEAIGGHSPLLDITRRLATKVEGRVHVPVRVAMRLWNPRIDDVVASCTSEGFTRLVVLALAQYSSHVYEGAVREAASKRPETSIDVVGVGPWGADAGLLAAYASRVRRAIENVPVAERAKTRVLFSAHSLPVSIVQGGDPYERHVREAAERLRSQLSEVTHTAVVFQSQGLGKGPGGAPIEWLGPDVRAALDQAKADGMAHVVFAPIGFLADHVEVLYDLDIEARDFCAELGLTYHRTASLNDDDDLVATLAHLLAPHLPS